MFAVCDCRDERGLCHCLLVDMYLWVPQAVSTASRSIESDLSDTTPTQPTQASMSVFIMNPSDILFSRLAKHFFCLVSVIQ